MKKTGKGTQHVVFQPTFGNRPDQYIGRNGVIEQFMAGLLFILLFKKLIFKESNRLFQWFQLFLYYFVNYISIYFEIVMSHYIAYSHYPFPRNTWICGQ